MRKIIIPFLLLLVIITSAAGCFSRPEIPDHTVPVAPLSPPGPSGTPVPIQQAQRVEGSFPMACGTNQGTVHFQTYIPEAWNGELFAMLLNGSPGTIYLSQIRQSIIAWLTTHGSEDFARTLQAQPDPYLGLLSGLLTQGYKVLEIKYERNPELSERDDEVGLEANSRDGFYSLCHHQGLENVRQHNGALYTQIITHLGYDPAQPQHRLSGFGMSLGGLQLTDMAYALEQKFEKVGIAGVVGGNSRRGCTEGVSAVRSPIPSDRYNGMAWTDFLSFARAVTLHHPGRSECYEYIQPNYNFENFSGRTRWDLGLFEGERIEPTRRGPLENFLSLPGLLGQAQYIRDIRLTPHTRHTIGGETFTGDAIAATTTTMIAPQNATTLHTYPGCGHVILGCPQAPTALNDILAYFNPSRRGLDQEQADPNTHPTETVDTATARTQQQEREEADALRRQRLSDAASARRMHPRRSGPTGVAVGQPD